MMSDSARVLRRASKNRRVNATSVANVEQPAKWTSAQ